MEIESWLLRAAREHPDQVALRDGELEIAYVRLEDLARRAAGVLNAHGIREGDSVAISLPRGVEYVITLYACWLLGAVPTVLDDRLTASELSDRTAGAKVLVDRALDLREVQPLVQVRRIHDSGEIATTVFTSGSSGTPKPVELTFGNWQAHNESFIERVGLSLDDRWLCAVPLSHVSGLGILIRTLSVGAEVVLQRKFDVKETVAAVESGSVTAVSCVPTMLRRLLDGGLVRNNSLSFVLVGGAPVSQDLLSRAEGVGIPLVTAYGKTETATQLATSERGKPRRTTPLSGIELRLADGGEIVARGPVIASASTDEDGWHLTGDLGELAPDGSLHLIGRKDALVITGGENVSPEEVEAVLLQHENVDECVVIGVPSIEWGQELRALVVTSRETSRVELTDLVREKLTSYKCPKEIAFVTAIPRLPSGKVDRSQALASYGVTRPSGRDS